MHVQSTLLDKAIAQMKSEACCHDLASQRTDTRMKKDFLDGNGNDSDENGNDEFIDDDSHDNGDSDSASRL